MIRRSIVALLLSLCATVVFAPPASAHAVLVATTPQAGYALSRGPDRIVLTFDESVSNPSVRVAGIRLGPPKTSGRQVVAAVRDTVPRGSYTVRWQVSATDGDVVAGSFGFGVGTAAPTSTGSVGTAGFPAAVVLRWMLFASLALILGGLAVELAMALRGLDLPHPGPPVRAAALLGFAAATGLVAHLMGSGSLIDGVTHPRLHLLVSASAGRIALAEWLSFGAATLVAVSRRGRWLTVLPMAAVVIAEGLRGHLHGRAGGYGPPLMVVHLAAAAVWVGALAHVVRVGYGWRSRRLALRELIGGYARLAVWPFLAVVASGSIAAVVVLPSADALVATEYGQVLIAKLALVVAAAGLAGWSRRRMPGVPALLPALRIEAVVLGIILAVTAGLVSLPVPTPATAVAPPPPVGPTLAVGTLAGQISVGAEASTGQLVVRLAAPDTGPRPRYRLTAETAAGKAIRTRSCGAGCFLAKPAWHSGDNPIRLNVAATGWHGGAATLHIPWPPRPDSRALGRVITAMRSVPVLIDAEQVTSDTSRPAPPVTPLRLSGRAFLATEVYRTGGPPADVVHSGDDTQLLLAYPAQGYYFDLTINADDRILTETISAPAHLITRQFRYPNG